MGPRALTLLLLLGVPAGSLAPAGPAAPGSVAPGSAPPGPSAPVAAGVPSDAALSGVSLVFTLTDVTLPAPPRLLEALDADEDGDLDLAVLGSGFAQLEYQVSVLDNDGAGGFTLGWTAPHPAAGFDSITPWLGADDLDLDGDLDAAITPSATFWATRLNDGQGRLSTFLNGSLAGGYGGHGGLGDADADGLPDLAQYNVDFGGTYVELNHGLGDGLFFGVPFWQLSAGDTETLVALLDLDGDGRAVPVVSCQQGLQRAVSGGAGFETILAGAFRDFDAADLDGDGVLDLVVAEPLADRVGVLLGLGGGAFGPPTWFATGDGPDQLALTDLDGDGARDVVTGNVTAGTISILLGDGAGGFGPKQDIATGSGPLGLAAGDLDGDGDTDLAVADAGATTVTILLQQTPPAGR